METEDGYLLSVIRIRYGKGETAENCKNGSQKRPVALFVSGIFMGAMPWLLNKDENVLGNLYPTKIRRILNLTELMLCIFI